MNRATNAFVHYTAPPIVGGVEAVIGAHTRIAMQSEYPVTVISGRGEQAALPQGTQLVLIPEIDSRHPRIAHMNAMLEKGEMPDDFDQMVARLEADLSPVLSRFDNVVVHNVFTKHFNLPLTAALHRLLDEGVIRRCVAWCHDFTWTSPHSRSQVHPGYPWDLLRTHRADVAYVVVSRQQQVNLANLFGCSPDRIRVIYNGVDLDGLLGLSPQGRDLIRQLGLLEHDLVLLMPVRITQAKNIECALRVAAVLKARGCRLRLVVTGPPDPHDAHSMAYFRSLQDLRRELDVEREVRFVFESGPDPDQPFLIDSQVVGDLFRVSDVMFMPSHYEGFGMPILEAGLAGVMVVCTEVPAAKEIGGEDVTLFDAACQPAEVADRILTQIEHSPEQRLRRRVRQNYSWQSIFRRDIEPLLAGKRARGDGIS